KTIAARAMRRRLTFHEPMRRPALANMRGEIDHAVAVIRDRPIPSEAPDAIARSFPDDPQMASGAEIIASGRRSVCQAELRPLNEARDWTFPRFFEKKAKKFTAESRRAQRVDSYLAAAAVRQRGFDWTGKEGGRVTITMCDDVLRESSQSYARRSSSELPRFG